MKRLLQFLAILILLCLSFPPSAVSAQQAGTWSEPIDLSNSVTDSGSPAIAADPTGRIHIVWLESLPGGERAILYTSLINGNWTTPIDIIPDVASNNGLVSGVAGPRLVSDEQGTLHLVYPGQNGITYSQAFAPQAGSPRAWSEPVVLVPESYFGGDFDLAIGSGSAAGMLCISYSIAFGSDSGIFVVCSHDDGRSWDQPYVVYENQNADQVLDKARLAIGPDGSLHVVWVIAHYPDTFPTLGLRYSRSTDGGLTWSSPFSLADGGYDDPTISLCAAPQVHIVWSGTNPDRYKFHRWSTDNGKTWSEIWRNKDLGGLQGRPDLTCDSSGRIHWLVVGTIYGGGVPKSAKNNDSLYHAVFNQGKWSPGELLLFGSVAETNMVNVQAAVALGDQLHVVVANPLPLTKSTDQFDIFYTSKLLDSPALQPKVLQNANPIPIPSPTIMESFTPSPSPTTISGQYAPPDTTPWQSVALGAFAALVAIILMLIIHFSRTR